MPEHICDDHKIPSKNLFCSLTVSFQGPSSICQTFSVNTFCPLSPLTLSAPQEITFVFLCEISYCFYLLIYKSLKGRNDILVIFKSLYKQKLDFITTLGYQNTLNKLIQCPFCDSFWVSNQQLFFFAFMVSLYIRYFKCLQKQCSCKI